MTREEMVAQLRTLEGELNQMPAQEGVSVYVSLMVYYERNCRKCGWKIVMDTPEVPELCFECQGRTRPRRDEVNFDQTFRK